MMEDIIKRTTCKGERIRIRVRDGEYETRTNTLEYFPKTLLGRHETRKKYYDAVKGKYIFDTTSDIFDAILFFYQSEGILSRPLFTSPIAFWDALIFFGLARQKKRESPLLPDGHLRRKIWIVLEHPELSTTAKIVAALTVLLVVISVAAFCWETVSREATSTYTFDVWFVIECSVTCLFSLDYILRLLVSPHRTGFFLSFLGMVDLGSILPFYILLILGQLLTTSVTNYDKLLLALRVFRLFKVLRLLKVIRYSQLLRNQISSLMDASKHFAFLCVLFVIAVIFCSTILYLVEDPLNPQFNSIPATFWFSVITMTTVGYGDDVPMTFQGQCVSVLIILTGTVVVVYLFIPVYVKFFEQYYCNGAYDNLELIHIYELR